MPFRRFGMGLALVALGFSLGVWLTLSFQKQSPLRKENTSIAGGSATGNALEIAQATIQYQDTLVTITLPVPTEEPKSMLTPVLDSNRQESPTVLVSLGSIPDRFKFSGNMVDPDGDGLGIGSPSGPDPWEGRTDSISRPLSTSELKSWLKARGLSFKRCFVIRNGAQIALSREGIDGPEFPDVSSIPGGLLPGDLLLYRQGTYRSATDLPPPRFRANAKDPITLLGWPGERIEITPPPSANPEGAGYWRWIGVQWTGDVKGVDFFRFEGCHIQSMLVEGSSDLVFQGNLISNTKTSLQFYETASRIVMLNNLITGKGVLIRGFHGDSIQFSSNVILSSGLSLKINRAESRLILKGNVLLGNGEGCVWLDSLNGDSLIIVENSIWNRPGCLSSTCKPLLRIHNRKEMESVRIMGNFLKDESGTVIDSSSGEFRFRDNTLISYPRPPMPWLRQGNQIQDPGFDRFKQL